MLPENKTIGNVGHVDSHNLISKKINDVNGLILHDGDDIHGALLTSKRITLTPGTYTITSAIDPEYLIGSGIGNTIITANDIDGAAIYAPSGQGILKDFTINGNGVSGSIGILSDDTHRPVKARWNGSIEINGFETGIKFCQSIDGEGIYHNDFGSFIIQSCTTGCLFDGNGVINDNHISALNTISCTTGMSITGANGLYIWLYSAENGTLGVGVYNGHRIIILGGWMENNTKHIHLGSADDNVKNFVYLGSIEGTFDDDVEYTYHEERSDLISWRHPVYGSPYHQFCGKWYFQHLEAATPGKLVLIGTDGNRYLISVNIEGNVIAEIIT